MKTAIALGTFDGVHKGHRAVIDAAVNSGFTPIAVAFPEAPRGIISGQRQMLTSASRKKATLLDLGVERVHYLEFEKVRELSPEEFLMLLKTQFNPAVIVCGFNYRFGKNGEGDTQLMARFCKAQGIRLTVVEPVYVDGSTVSSTAIRELLASGDTEKANELLYRPFGFRAPVIHGDERGRTIGFPTINQVYPDDAARPKFGVYKSVVTVGGAQYDAITNIGLRPTYKNGMISAETHIIGFSGDLYGAVIDVRLVRFIREERKFSSLNELKENIENDLKQARD